MAYTYLAEKPNPHEGVDSFTTLIARNLFTIMLPRALTVNHVHRIALNPLGLGGFILKIATILFIYRAYFYLDSSSIESLINPVEPSFLPR
jgi:hypothetical protein